MFLVGPDSSGADPDPVCYRKNGYLSLTDANLVLGRLQPDFFPKIFGPTEDQSLDLKAAEKAMAELTDRVNAYYSKKDKPPITAEQVAFGLIDVANEVMIRPVREISVMRGFDIREHLLAAFGGAGPQHACAVARELGISKIFIYRFSGIFSAYGMGLADVVVERHKPSAAVYSETILPEVLNGLDGLRKEAGKDLIEQEFSTKNIISIAYLNLRY